ncbi:MAG: molecular chaperone TorD family protein [Syntrophales bacterium]|nr:molecular chaperone TorD family protein [Syntrophales bacterium]
MTSSEKERFCAFAASIMAPPDGAMLDDLEQDELRTLIGECVRLWGAERHLPSLFVNGRGTREDFLSALQGEYERLFGQWQGERISLVESTYKPWTADKGCGMVFAASTGLVMGDSALHMQAIYRQLSLEVPEAFGSMPDHLVLELEFLALLYRSESVERIERFIGDHLDWIPELKATLEKANPHPFYRDAIEIIHWFLQQEVKNEGVDHGEKKIH